MEVTVRVFFRCRKSHGQSARFIKHVSREQNYRKNYLLYSFSTFHTLQCWLLNEDFLNIYCNPIMYNLNYSMRERWTTYFMLETAIKTANCKIMYLYYYNTASRTNSNRTMGNRIIRSWTKFPEKYKYLSLCIKYIYLDNQLSINRIDINLSSMTY